MDYRFMRMVLFFDLPSISKKDQREYRIFVKFIKSIGFSMFQESVYTKLCLDETVVKSIMSKLKNNLPNDGFVSMITLTEKQFSSIEILVGQLDTDVILSDESVIKL